jgi:hypothetical protein
MRRTAHRRRFHRDRIVRNRQRQYAGFRRADREWSRELPDGRLESRQAYFGCSRPRCSLCHPGKHWHRSADRARSRREWQRLEIAGWGGFPAGEPRFRADPQG